MTRLYTLVLVHQTFGSSATLRKHVEQILHTIERVSIDVTFTLRDDDQPQLEAELTKPHSRFSERDNSNFGIGYLVVDGCINWASPSERLNDEKNVSTSPEYTSGPINNAAATHYAGSVEEVTGSWSLELLRDLSVILKANFGLATEAESLQQAVTKTRESLSYAGLNISPRSAGGAHSDEEFLNAVVDQLEFYLEAARSRRLISFTLPCTRGTSTQQARPMGVIEKILTNSAIGLIQPEVSPGQMICVGVEWVLTSELLWGGMEKTYNQMKRPRPHRNDRIWLAVDHTVDPRTKHLPKQQELMAKSEKFRDEVKIIK